MEHTTPKGGRDITIATLHCKACGSQVACRSIDIPRFVAIGWPSCCGRELSLLIGQPATLVGYGRDPAA